MTSALRSELGRICAWLEESGPPTISSLAKELRERLDGPLRVALIGRAKAGKSTLVNALIGERVAPTDLSECTRYVTWYEDGPDYTATCRTDDGAVRLARFDRLDGRARIELPQPGPGGFAEITVRLPSRRLRRTRLADTPGFDSNDPEVGARTRHLVLAVGEGQPQPRVDAIVYLLRHAHRADAAFLDVLDEAGVGGSAVNALGVLSRADELLDAGADAMDASAALARSYSRDPYLAARLRQVLAVSGLLAETAVTLQEQEFAWLRQVCAEPDERLQSMLLSVDRFCDEPDGTLPGGARAHLVERFGLFGLRWSIRQVRSGAVPNASALARSLEQVSGITALRDLIEQKFELRSRRLVCQSVLGTLRVIASGTIEMEPRLAEALKAQLERTEIIAHELAEMRLLEAALAVDGPFGPEEVAEMDRLVSDATPRARLGLGEAASREAALAAAVAGATRWRARGDNPLTSPSERALFEIAARSYEGLYAELSAG